MTALLFDFDGTIADTIPHIVECARLALDELGRPEVTDAQIRAQIGLPMAVTGDALLGPGNNERYRDAYQRAYQSLGAPDPPGYDGLPELIRDLHRRGLKMAIVTSKRLEPIERSLTGLGLRDCFDALVTAESCAKHKPAPDPAYRALEQLAEKPQQALFIGDSLFDLACGRNAGILTCGVTWGAESAANLRQGGADWLAEDADQLRRVIEDFLEQQKDRVSD